MTREARTMAGIILLTVPTIQYGGYFLLSSLTNRNSGYAGSIKSRMMIRLARFPLKESRLKTFCSDHAEMSW
jgi:hypothetical protein